MIYLIVLLIITFLAYKLIDRHTHDIEIHREEIYHDNLDKEIKILHLSDLHFNFDKKYQDKLLKIVNNLEYDLIVFTGDYINKKQYMVNLDQFLKEIDINSNKKFAVWGNNDHKYDLEELKDIFENNGIELVNNKNIALDIHEQNINLIGVDTPDIGKDNYDKATEEIDLSNGYNILLSHTYHIIEKEKLDEIDLVLVGDTHGGQINLPVITNLLKNNFALKYISGKYILNHLIMIVNRGIGYNIIPFRINCKPEVIQININNKK